MTPPKYAPDHIGMQKDFAQIIFLFNQKANFSNSSVAFRNLKIDLASYMVHL